MDEQNEVVGRVSNAPAPGWSRLGWTHRRRIGLIHLGQYPQRSTDECSLRSSYDVYTAGRTFVALPLDLFDRWC